MYYLLIISPIIILALGVASARAVAVRLRARLLQAGNHYPVIISGIAAVITFLIIVCALALVMLASIPFER